MIAVANTEDKLRHALNDMLDLIDWQQPGVMQIPGHKCGVKDLPSYQRARSLLIVSEDATADAVDRTENPGNLLADRVATVRGEPVGTS